MGRTIQRLKWSLLSIMAVMALAAIVACGGEEPTQAPTATSVPAATATTAPAPTATTAPTPTAGPVQQERVDVASGSIGYGISGFKVEDFGEPKYGGMNQVLFCCDIRTWDAAVPCCTHFAAQLSPMFNTLLQFNPWTFDRFDISGDAAASWEQSNADGTIWTFSLKPGAVFWDGSPVTAQDWVYSFDRLVGRGDKEGGDREVKQFFGPHFDRAVAVDDNTLEIHLLHPWADFVSFMADDHFTVMKQSHYEELDSKANAGDETIFDVENGWKNMMLSGPFKPVNVESNRRWTLEANPIYWKKDPEGRDLPYLDGAEFFTVRGKDATQAAWEAEQLWQNNAQNNGNMDPGQLWDLVEREGGKFIAYPVPCCPGGLSFNTSKPPFDDVRVRRAISLALDRDKFNDLVWDGRGILGTPCGAPGHPLCWDEEQLRSLPGIRKVPNNKDGEKHPDDIAEAKRLLEEAGYPDGFDTTYIYSGSVSGRDEYTPLSDDLKALGIELTATVLDTAARIEALQNGQFDMITSGTGAGVVTPDTYLNRYYPLDSENNVFDWTYDGSEDLLGLVAQQSQEIDLAQRRAVLDDIQDILINKDSYWLVLILKTWSRVFNTEKVAGQMPTQSGQIESRLEQIWLVDATGTSR